MDYETEFEMRRLIHRCAECQDQGQIEELATLFQYGEIILAGVGQVFVGPQGVKALMSRTMFYDANGQQADPALVYATSRAMHYISNLDAYFDEARVPCANSRFMIVQQTTADLRIVLGGRYVDSFVRIDGRLHFKRRITEVHLVGNSMGYLASNPWVA